MKKGLTYIADRTGQWRYSTQTTTGAESGHISNDENEQWLQPQSVYRAAETIRRGQPVSPSLLEDIKDSSGGYDPYPYVSLTDTSKHKKCLGLAMEYAEKGQPVHIMSIGQFKYDSNTFNAVLANNNKKEPTSVDGNVVEFSDKEYYPTFNFNLTDSSDTSGYVKMYRSLIGKPVYVRSRRNTNLSSSEFRPNEETTETNYVNDVAGELTVDANETYYGNHNIIQVGIIADAPNSVGETDLCIELQLEGDGRGPLEHTQWELVAGEQIIASSTDQAVVLAIGSESAQKFETTIVCTTPEVEETTFKTNDFMAIQRMDGRTWFIPFNSSITTIDALKGAVSSAGTYEDMAFVNVALHYAETYNRNHVYDATDSGTTSESPIVVKNFANAFSFSRSDVASNVKNVIENLKLGYAYVSERAYADSIMTTINPGTSTDTHKVDSNNIVSVYSTDGTNEYTLYSAYATIQSIYDGGYYEVYISDSLRGRYFDGTVVKNKGSYDNKGKAVYADIRIGARQNIAGVYNNLVYDTLLTSGANIIALHQGAFDIDTTVFDIDKLTDDEKSTVYFTPGATYYLGTHGKLTTTPIDYTDSVVKIGVAQSETRLLVDCNDVRQYDSGAMPVGYIKPTVDNNAEYGFLLMDGGETKVENLVIYENYDSTNKTGTIVSLQNRYDVDRYKLLFERLKSWYSETQLDVRTNLTYVYTLSDGTESIDTSHTKTFIVPKVVYSPNLNNMDVDTVNYAEIKWLEEALFKQIPRVPYIRVQDKTFVDNSSIDNKPSIDPIDISSLIHYGPIENSVYDVSLEDLDIHLYVNLNSGDAKSTGVYSDDTPDWVEIPQGFTLFNNTTTYGYRWKITTAPINNNSTNKELLSYYLTSDLGEFKNDDTTVTGRGIAYKVNPYEPPRLLYGYQYKVYVARHEYGIRMFDIGATITNAVSQSLIDPVTGKPSSNPISGNAVYDYILNKNQEANVEVTDKLLVGTSTGESATLQAYTNDSSFIKGPFKFYSSDGKILYINGNSISVSELPTAPSMDYTTLSSTATSIYDQNIVPFSWLRSFATQDWTSKNIFGTINNGYGDINAEKLMGISLGSGENQTPDGTKSLSGWIPFVDKSSAYKFTLGNNETFTGTDSKTSTINYSVSKNVTVNNNIVTSTYSLSGATGVVYTPLSVVCNYSTTDKVADYDIELKKGEAFASMKVGSLAFASSVEYKTVYNTNLRTYAVTLDKDGLKDISSFDEITWTAADTATHKLASALQAAYELPLGLFSYKQEPSWTKKYLGIIIEQINHVKTNLTDAVTRDILPESKTYAANATNSFISTDTSTDKSRKHFDNSFSYTEDERDSIKSFLTLITDNNEHGQTVLSSIGMLFSAARETQERLLKLEASEFGRDAPTIPGDKTNVTAEIEKALPNEEINQTPTYIGVNRILRALCYEVFNVYDPTKAAELSPKYGSYRARLNDLYKEVEGENGGHNYLDSTKKGNALNPLNGTSSWHTTTYDGEYTATSEQDKDDNEAEYAQTSTYPKDTLLSECTNNNVVATAIPDQGAFDGLNDAVNRIVQKLNVLTAEVNGKDNILEGAVRLNIIRENVKLALNELYLGANYNDPNAYTTDNKPFTDENGNTLSRLDILDRVLYARNYRDDQFTDYSSISGSATDSVGKLPTKNSDYTTYKSVIDLIITTLGDDIVPLKSANKTQNTFSNKRLYDSVNTRLLNIEKALDYVVTKINGSDAQLDYSNASDTGTLNYSINNFVTEVSRYIGLSYSDGNWIYGATTNVTNDLANKSNTYSILSDIVTRVNQIEETDKVVKRSLGDYYTRNLTTEDNKPESISNDTRDILRTIYGSNSNRGTSDDDTSYINNSIDTNDLEHGNIVNNMLELLYATTPKTSRGDALKYYDESYSATYGSIYPKPSWKSDSDKNHYYYNGNSYDSIDALIKANPPTNNISYEITVK